MTKKVFDIINKISLEHSSKIFGYLTQEDLKNEIWVICLDRLGEYNKKKGKLEHFLRVAVKNRLINRFKDVTKSVRSPCPRCPFFDTHSPSNCSKFGDNREDCKKWRNYKFSVESRNNLLNTMDVSIDRPSNKNHVDEIINEELKTIVLSKINKEFIGDFNKFVSGIKISKNRIKKLRKEIARITNDEEMINLTVRGKNA